MQQTVNKEMIHVVAVQVPNRGIGYRGRLLYRHKQDMRRFKKLTQGHVVIMGRKTYESLPGRRALPQRVNVVLTRDTDYRAAQGVYVFHDWERLRGWLARSHPEKHHFVIGGSSLYEDSWPWTTAVFVTEFVGKKPADAFYLCDYRKGRLQKSSSSLSGVRSVVPISALEEESNGSDHLSESEVGCARACAS